MIKGGASRYAMTYPTAQTKRTPVLAKTEVLFALA